MKKSPSLLYPLLFVTCLLAVQEINGHSHHSHPSIYINTGPQLIVEERPHLVILENEPPALIAEEVSPCPGPDYCWIPGNWYWENRWVWRGGRWEPRPHVGAVYVPGNWSRGDQHWLWIEGGWR